jgi:8-oxo-dGTP pyrophosphatase MutT (NUDIX family)
MPNRIFSDLSFKRWKSKVDAKGVIFEEIKCVGEVVRSDDRVYTALIDCRLVTAEGSYSRCLVLRGDTVVVVPLLKCRENGGEYTLLVEQFRITQGETIEEFPAGMVDRKNNDPVTAAVLEVREELGIDVNFSELLPLSETPFSTIPSLTDEAAYFLYFTREVSIEFLLGINGQHTGLHEENEFIRVRVHPLADLPSTCNTLGVFVASKLLENHLGRSFLEPDEPLSL